MPASTGWCSAECDIPGSGSSNGLKREIFYVGKEHIGSWCFGVIYAPKLKPGPAWGPVHFEGEYTVSEESSNWTGEDCYAITVHDVNGVRVVAARETFWTAPEYLGERYTDLCFFVERGPPSRSRVECYLEGEYTSELDEADMVHACGDFTIRAV